MSKSTLPYFRAHIFDPYLTWDAGRVSCLFDSGASLSVLNNNSEFLKNHVCNIRESSKILCGFDGKKSRAAGEITIAVKDTNNNIFIFPTTLAEIHSCTLILGWDIISKCKIKIEKGILRLITGHSRQPDRGLKSALFLANQGGKLDAFRGGKPGTRSAKCEADRSEKPEDMVKCIVFQGTDERIPGLKIQNQGMYPTFCFDLHNRIRFYAVNQVNIPKGVCAQIEIERNGILASSEIKKGTVELIEPFQENHELAILPQIVAPGLPILNICVENTSSKDIIIEKGAVVAYSEIIEEKVLENSESVYSLLECILFGKKSETEVNTDSIKINSIKLSREKNLREIPRKIRNFEPLDMSKVKAGPSLSTDQQARLNELISKFHYIFSRNDFDLGSYSGPEKYRIELTTDEVQMSKVLRVPEAQRQLVEDHIEKLLASDVIEECSADIITTGFVCVRKKDGSYRLANDSRSINAVTKPKTNFLIPKISDILAEISNNKYYSSLDMNSSYYQVRIDERQKDLYTFMHPDGKRRFRFKYAPFGSKLISFVFQSIIAGSVLKDISSVVSYIDDIIIFSKNFESHIEVLERVFERFSEFNLSLKLKKCEFGFDSIKAFGFKVDSAGYSPLESRVKKLKALRCPENRKEMKASLAALCYYRNFIEKFTELSAPMYKLTSSNVKFEMTSEIRKNWNQILDNLSETVLCTKPLHNGTFHLMTDASILGIACVLFEVQSGVLKVILCDSKVLTDHQKRYNIAQLELFAISFFFKKLEKMFIFEKSVKVFCDNLSVCHIIRNLKNYPITNYNPVSRHLLFLSKFNIEIYHKRGDSPEFLIVDLLSRQIISPESKIKVGLKNKECLVSVKNIAGEFVNLDTFDVSHLPKEKRFQNFKKLFQVRTRKDWESLSKSKEDLLRRETREKSSPNGDKSNPSGDGGAEAPEREKKSKCLGESAEEQVNELVQSLSEGQSSSESEDSDGDAPEMLEEVCFLSSRMPSNLNHLDLLKGLMKDQTNDENIKNKIRKLRKEKSIFFAKNEKIDGKVFQILFYGPQKLLVVPEGKIFETLKMIHKHESMKSLNLILKRIGLYIPYQKVKTFIMGCDICMSSRSSKSVEISKFKTIDGTDHPFSVIHSDISFIDNKPIIATVDAYTKYVIFDELENMKGECLAFMLAEHILHFNVPKVLVTDNGSNYESQEIESMLEALNIEHKRISPGNSKGNGLAELANRNLQTELRLSKEHINLEDKGNLRLILKLSAYIINSRVNSQTGFSPFELVFKERPNFPYRVPSLSKTKISSLRGYVKNMYEKAVKMRELVNDLKDMKIKELEGQVLKKVNIKAGDFIKIRNVRKPGEPRKLFRPFSNSYYKVIRVHHYTKSLEVEKVVSSDVVRKERFRVPIYRVKKCLPEVEAEKRLRVKNYTETQEEIGNEKKLNDEREINTEGDNGKNGQKNVNVELKEKSSEKKRRKVRFQESGKAKESPGQPELRRSQRLKNKK